MIIAVEGMDGVGKTEVSKYICDTYGFKYIEKPVHYFYADGVEQNYADFMRVAEKMYDIDDNRIKSWYFGLGNIYAARMFKEQDVVIDRHLVSNYYWNGDLESEPIYEALIAVSGVPDLTILLYATPQTRMERIRQKNKDDPDLSDPDMMDDGYDKMFSFIEKFKLPYIVIDTENKQFSEVTAIVDKEIAKLKGKPLYEKEAKKLCKEKLD